MVFFEVVARLSANSQTNKKRKTKLTHRARPSSGRCAGGRLAVLLSKSARAARSAGLPAQGRGLSLGGVGGAGRRGGARGRAVARGCGTADAEARTARVLLARREDGPRRAGLHIGLDALGREKTELLRPLSLV